MLAEHKRLKEEIASVKAQLRELPDGKLICARNGTQHKWYLNLNQKNTYIPKKQHHLAEQLAYKKYLTLHLSDLQQELQAIDLYLKNHNTSNSAAQNLLTKPSEYQSLLSRSLSPISSAKSDWMNFPYETNPRSPEQLIHKTISGHTVRSKSEALIATFLHTNQIPFRYECSLRLGDTVLYPDFTILHPHNDTICYWEHFGLMDDPAYSKNACSKLQLYASHNIIPTINLICTYETRNVPLCADKINHLIEEYFL